MAMVRLRPASDRRVILEDGSELTEARTLQAGRFTRMLVAMGDAELVEEPPAKVPAKTSAPPAASPSMQGG